MDTSADFTSANLPNLRHLAVVYGTKGETLGQLYDSILPQLDGLLVRSLCVADFGHILPLSSPLQSLHVGFKNPNEGLSESLDHLNRMEVKELSFIQRMKRESSDNWTTDFESIEEFKKLVGRKKELEQVSLDFRFSYVQRPSEDVSAQFLARWKGIKGEFESICVKNGIEVEVLTCCLYHGNEEIWTTSTT
jgi:hypothetical protein